MLSLLVAETRRVIQVILYLHLKFNVPVVDEDKVKLIKRERDPFVKNE